MSLLPRLAQVVSPQEHTEPTKRIHDGADVEFFLHTLAYRDLMTFILQLNRALVPRKSSIDGTIQTFRLDHIRKEDLLPQVVRIQQIVTRLEALLSEAPPDTGPRRFGNVSFRKWYKLVDDQTTDLLHQALPATLHPAAIELKVYLLGSFGSPQRLDYGTGHELSFVAFLACLWKLGYFDTRETNAGLLQASSEDGMKDQQSQIERQIVLVLIQPYLNLIRNLIITYNLEPAGSHGVWGLDDNSFLPYIFGSAQLCPPIPSPEADPPTPTPTSGSLSSSPDPSIVTKQNLVQKEASSNLYFGAINFIYTVKRGPFWEHSPMLFDISGIKDGWGKINKGLIKMYNVEVLSKFPVVQHFPFGNLLQWERDPEAKAPVHTTHTASQPLRDPMSGGSGNNATAMRPPSGTGPVVGTAAPWATGASGVGSRPPAPPTGFVNGVTQAPWARSATSSTAGTRSLLGSARKPGLMQNPRPVRDQASRTSGARVEANAGKTGPESIPEVNPAEEKT